MKLTVLGCSGTFPGPDSACSSYVVEHDGFRLLIDVGNGALGSLQQHMGLLDINAVLVSHLHGDHCLDLVAYSYALRYHPTGPLPRMPVYGPVATRHRLCGAFDDWPSRRPVRRLRLSAASVPARARSARSTSSWTGCAIRLRAYGMRIRAGGRTFTYSGDTSSCKQVEHLGPRHQPLPVRGELGAFAGQPAGDPHER